MKEFLRSKKSLKVYTNYHELLATANLFNITISVFTYDGVNHYWSEIRPDQVMVSETENRFGKLIPDMALYHSSKNH